MVVEVGVCFWCCSVIFGYNTFPLVGGVCIIYSHDALYRLSIATLSLKACLVLVGCHTHTHTHTHTHYNNEEMDYFEKTVIASMLRNAWCNRQLFYTHA